MDTGALTMASAYDHVSNAWLKVFMSRLAKP